MGSIARCTTRERDPPYRVTYAVKGTSDRGPRGMNLSRRLLVPRRSDWMNQQFLRGSGKHQEAMGRERDRECALGRPGTRLVEECTGGWVGVT